MPQIQVSEAFCWLLKNILFTYRSLKRSERLLNSLQNCVILIKTLNLGILFSYLVSPPAVGRTTLPSQSSSSALTEHLRFPGQEENTSGSPTSPATHPPGQHEKFGNVTSNTRNICLFIFKSYFSPPFLITENVKCFRACPDEALVQTPLPLPRSIKHNFTLHDSWVQHSLAGYSPYTCSGIFCRAAVTDTPIQHSCLFFNDQQLNFVLENQKSFKETKHIG